MTKRSSFWMIKDADMPDSKLCRFAEACPKIQKTNDSIIDQERELQRKNVMKVIDAMMRAPDIAGSIYDVVEERVNRLKEQQSAATTGGTWKVSTVGHLDENWIATWIMSKASVTRQALEKAKVWEPDTCRHLFAYMNNVTNGLSLPDECNSKQITSLAFDKRWESQGRRLGKLGDTAIFDSNGNVQWNKIGPYELVFGNDGKMTMVRHRGSGDETNAPPEVSITREYALEFGYSDARARAVRGVSRINIADFFGKDAGPYKQKSISGKSKIFADLVMQGMAEQEQRLEEARRGQLAENTIDLRAARDKTHKEKNAARARAALARRQEERQTRRRLSLGTPIVAPITAD